MFDNFEFNPAHAGLALLGGFISMYVMKNTTAGLFTKILGFVLTSVICYFVVSFINKGN